MTINFDFVRTLGTAQEHIPNLDDVQPGTHADCILKESLRPVEEYSTNTRIAEKDFILFTSFPDILPRKLLASASAIYTRSEFLTLRAIGDQSISLPLTGRKAENFLKAVDRVAETAPQIIYHRMMDYNPDEFSFLTNSSKKNIRGSARLLADEALLKHELKIIKRWQDTGKTVRVVLPYISAPDEQAAIQKIMEELGPDEIGIMLERVEHAEHIKDYPLADFVVPGPSDLTADLHSSKRGDYRDDTATQQVIIDLTQRLADDLATVSSKTYLIAVKFLVDRIHDSLASNRIRNAYMPHQLIQAK